MIELPDRPDILDDFTKRRKRLIELIVNVDERKAISEITDMLATGWKPADVMEICINAMQEVGKRFEEGRYFIAALIMAGEIMRQTTELLEPYLPRHNSEEIVGDILLGTISGDIHDLGKNLFATLARCEGYQVVDLGVDVNPESFLTEAKKIKPDLIGISCLLTSALPDLKSAVELLRRESSRHQALAIIGGQSVDEHIFNYVKADYWARDAAQGIEICQKIMTSKLSAISSGYRRVSTP
jgi:methanogenic corrinoid protein MtbC1